METSKKVTIKSIAEELGVSFSTVSKSLNDSPAVKDETREMVIEKARSMGYSPNMLARGLRTKSTKTIAVIFNDVENPVLTYIFKTISIYMAKYGYTTLICDSQFSCQTERSTISTVLSRLPEAVIIAPATTSYNNIDLLLDSSSNIIVFDENQRGVDCNFVDVDYEYGGYVSACELLSKGHRDILIITEPLDYPYSSYYVRGIRTAFSEYRVEFREDYIKFVHSSLESACSIVLSLWDAATHTFELPFSAAMCFGDNFALGVYKAAAQLGLSIPNDISVIGFDNNEVCEFANPPLTTVHLPRERMASSCIEILESGMEQEKRGKLTFSLSPHLVSRKSVKIIY